jgi:hypothetical protein
VDIGQLSEQAERKDQQAQSTMLEKNTAQVFSCIHAEIGWNLS